MSFAEFVRPGLAARLKALALDVTYVRGEGDELFYERDGVQVAVLDCVGGFGSSLFGHNHPRLTGRLTDVVASGRPFNAQASVRGAAGRLGRALSERIEAVTGRSTVATFANSGAEAVEAALKHAELERTTRLSALQAHLDHVRTGARRVDVPAGAVSVLDAAQQSIDALAAVAPTTLSITGAFHGKTTGALQLTHRGGYRTPWAALGSPVVFVPAGDADALSAAIGAASTTYLHAEVVGSAVVAHERRFVNVTALFAEPIQGEGGVVELDAHALGLLRDAATAGGFPLVLDEIQCGMGRTGTFLASEATGVYGDYVLLGKSLGGGLCKIAVLLVDSARYLPKFGILHTSTFADDDLSAEVAIAALELLDDGQVLRRCRQTGAYAHAALRALQKRHPTVIADVRGRGLMIGVDIADLQACPSPLIALLSDQEQLGWALCGYLLHVEGIRVLPTLAVRTTLRIQPSAFVSTAQIDRLVGALDRLCAVLAEARAGELVRFLTGSSLPSPPAVRLPVAVPAPADTHVGFLTHFLDARDLVTWDPSLGALCAETCARFLAQTRGSLDPFVVAEPVVVSVTGASVRATVFALPFTARQAQEHPEWAHDMVQQGVDRAAALGCSLVGLGGHTSILTRNGTTLRAPTIGITTGNALTTVAAVEGLFAEAQAHGVARRVLGIVGAAGNIGQAMAELAVDDVDELVLVGRGHRRLRRLADRLSGRIDASRIRISDDLVALRTCSLVLSATNAVAPIVLAEHIAADRPVVIGDVAVPCDVHPDVPVQRPNARLVRGGVVLAPSGQDVVVPGMDLGPGGIYGCLAETLVLGLEHTGGDGVVGDLTPEVLRTVRQCAMRHGFAFAGRQATAASTGAADVTGSPSLLGSLG